MERTPPKLGNVLDDNMVNILNVPGDGFAVGDQSFGQSFRHDHRKAGANRVPGSEGRKGEDQGTNIL